MLIQQVAHFNDLSPKLRKEIEDKVKGFGKTVRYKFDISNPNPDPTFVNGKVLWPTLYTLDPAVFNINDPHEDRDGKSKSKRIAIVEGVDEKGMPNRFKKVRVHGRRNGILLLNLETEEDFATAVFLELHPKLTNGKFFDRTKKQVVSRIDEVANATEQRTLRTAKVKAMNAAQQMSDQDRVSFADAMMWDSTQDPSVIGNMIEELAETDPVFFNDLIEGKNIEFQAVVKQALDRQVIGFDLAAWKFFWHSNQQPITVVSPVGDKNHVEKMAEWFQIGGKNADEAYKKIKSLIK